MSPKTAQISTPPPYWSNWGPNTRFEFLAFVSILLLLELLNVSGAQETTYM